MIRRKVFTVSICSISLITLLFGCGTTSDPKSVAQTYANDMISANFKQASSLQDESSNANSVANMSSSPDYKLIKDMFKHVKVVMGNERIKGSSATVDATVTTLNMRQVIAKTMQDALRSAFSGNRSTNSTSSYQALDNAINDPSIGTTTENVEIYLTDTNSGWKIAKNNSAFDSALMDGVDKIFNDNRVN